jgi:hypothetical protein
LERSLLRRRSLVEAGKLLGNCYRAIPQLAEDWIELSSHAYTTVVARLSAI